MTIRAFRPVQLVGVPDKVKMKVSQFTPSTHVLSSNEPPPAVVPTQFMVGPAGLSVPELGAAERELLVENASTARTRPVSKKSVATVARAVIEEELFFIAEFSIKDSRRDSASLLLFENQQRSGCIRAATRTAHPR